MIEKLQPESELIAPMTDMPDDIGLRQKSAAESASVRGEPGNTYLALGGRVRPVNLLGGKVCQSEGVDYARPERFTN